MRGREEGEREGGWKEARRKARSNRCTNYAAPMALPLPLPSLTIPSLLFSSFLPTPHPPQDEFISPLIKTSLDTLYQAYRLYGPDNVVGSYNGGKDACVIMQLMRASHAKWHSDVVANLSAEAVAGAPSKPRVVYFDNPHEFPEILELLHETVGQFDLSMAELKGCSFKDGLEAVIKKSSAGGQMGFVLGTRQGDPNCEGQEKFAPSSTWMPPFMRVNPGEAERGAKDGWSEGWLKRSDSKGITPPSYMTNNIPLVPYPNPFRDSLRSSQSSTGPTVISGTSSVSSAFLTVPSTT